LAATQTQNKDKQIKEKSEIRVAPTEIREQRREPHPAYFMMMMMMMMVVIMVETATVNESKQSIHKRRKS
jgi:ABC-type Na+ efflux pump permease subunit